MVHTVVELDTLGEERNGDVQQILASITGRMTVPNVLVKGVSIGGGDEVSAMEQSGELLSLLRQQGCEFLDA